MSLKSIFGFSAALGALAVFAAACSAAPDGSPSTATESSSEAIAIRCIPPPIPVCPPFLAAEGRPCPSVCPVGEEWSLPLCHCAPIPPPPPVDAGSSDAAADAACPAVVACTSTNQEWSPTACACECITPEPVAGCGPLRTWNPALCECVPTGIICPEDIVCPLEGASASSDATILQCCGPIRPLPITE